MSAALRPPADNLLSLLACPLCGSRLELTPSEARCPRHGAFRRIGPIFSFLRQEQHGFDDHWSHAARAQRPEAKSEVARRFLSLLEPPEQSGGASFHMLDVGCGDGVHIEQLLAGGKRFAVAGLDYSLGALRNALQLGGEWLPVHADAQHLPFADGGFDATISFGVQAYLDDPQQGLREMVRVTRPGGLIGLWFAPRRRGIAGSLFEAARAVVPRLPVWAQHRAADMLVPFLGMMPTSSALSLRTGTWRECREVILVNIAPSHIAFPTAQEIISSLERLGCEMVAKRDAIEGEYWARKLAR